MTTYQKRFTRQGFPRLVNDDEVVIMCEGLDQLLRKTQQFGSLNRAAKDMGMAYSKAWTRLRAASQSMGFDYLTTNGAHGSQVTPQAIALMQAYEQTRDNMPTYVTADIPKG